MYDWPTFYNDGSGGGGTYISQLKFTSQLRSFQNVGLAPITSKMTPSVPESFTKVVNH